MVPAADVSGPEVQPIPVSGTALAAGLARLMVPAADVSGPEKQPIPVSGTASTAGAARLMVLAVPEAGAPSVRIAIHLSLRQPPGRCLAWVPFWVPAARGRA